MLETRDKVAASVCGGAEQERACPSPARAGSAVAPAVTKARTSVCPFSQAMSSRRALGTTALPGALPSPVVSRIDGEAGAWREMLAVDVVSRFANYCKALLCL